MTAERAVAALEAAGLEHTVRTIGKVSSLVEAAAALGVEPAGIVKTLVVRRAEDDYLFVLVPGDRTISWPKLRALLEEFDWRSVQDVYGSVLDTPGAALDN
jgi:prolyl-tRNA editing enzyme YbaK/EbsC (Cys-tRNA(Pro) deacylase)